MTPKRRAELARQIAELEPTRPVQVLRGAYGEWAHERVPPETPAGRLLAAGWEAVPTLAEAASDEKLSAAKRAWLLALLHSITGELSPTEHPRSPLGEYEVEVRPHGGTTQSGGFWRASGIGRGSPCQPDAEAQLEMAQRWRRLVASVIDVREE